MQVESLPNQKCINANPIQDRKTNRIQVYTAAQLASPSTKACKNPLLIVQLGIEVLLKYQPDLLLNPANVLFITVNAQDIDHTTPRYR
ncbi:hypothetical protein C5167_006531 [Papaver somniferum]|uniref:Uncharacterized protein n=1 Tax=Papaver somniferum TaxID=3469 RepID=A0A4Y7JH22_PAPSO|nr:hypothetical protein C5167_006531 [Papaver somniferum]